MCANAKMGRSKRSAKARAAYRHHELWERQLVIWLVCSYWDVGWANRLQREARAEGINLEVLLVSRTNIVGQLRTAVATGRRALKVLFAPCHGYEDIDEAMVNLSRNWHRTPPLEGAELSECAGLLARMAVQSVELLTCCQGRPPQLAWWVDQMRSPANRGKHVGAFNYSIRYYWETLNRWIVAGCPTHGFSYQHGYRRCPIGPL